MGGGEMHKKWFGVFRRLLARNYRRLLTSALGSANAAPNEVPRQHGNGRTPDVFVPVTYRRALH